MTNLSVGVTERTTAFLVFQIQQLDCSDSPMCDYCGLLHSDNFHLLGDKKSSEWPAKPEANRSEHHFKQQMNKLANCAFQHRCYDKTNTKHKSKILVLGSVCHCFL